MNPHPADRRGGVTWSRATRPAHIEAGFERLAEYVEYRQRLAGADYRLFEGLSENGARENTPVCRVFS